MTNDDNRGHVDLRLVNRWIQRMIKEMGATYKDGVGPAPWELRRKHDRRGGRKR